MGSFPSIGARRVAVRGSVQGEERRRPLAERSAENGSRDALRGARPRQRSGGSYDPPPAQQTQHPAPQPIQRESGQASTTAARADSATTITIAFRCSGELRQESGDMWSPARLCSHDSPVAKSATPAVDSQAASATIARGVIRGVAVGPGALLDGPPLANAHPHQPDAQRRRHAHRQQGGHRDPDRRRAAAPRRRSAR